MKQSSINALLRKWTKFTEDEKEMITSEINKDKYSLQCVREAVAFLIKTKEVKNRPTWKHVESALLQFISAGREQSDNDPETIGYIYRYYQIERAFADGKISHIHNEHGKLFRIYSTAFNNERNTYGLMLYRHDNINSGKFFMSSAELDQGEYSGYLQQSQER